MTKVFLSHSSIDKVFVRKIKKSLYPYGTASWLDEQEIYPGDPLWRTILIGINQSDRALVFVTENSQNSDWVLKEIKEFLTKEKEENQTKIIPILFTANPPKFLTNRLYVSFFSKPFSHAIKDLLVGINRNKSVIVLEPLRESPFMLKEFGKGLTEFRKSAENGDLMFVYDFYKLLEIFQSSIVRKDDYHYSETLKIVIPKMFDFLIALTPKLIKTIFCYYKNDPAVYFVAEKVIQFIWKSLFVIILDKLYRYGDINQLKSNSEYNFNSCFDELERVYYEMNTKAKGRIGVLDKVLWLEYLNSSWEDTYDIGFRGSKTSDGIQIFDATHVRIRLCDIREDSLTIFRDTTPDQEFMIYVWVNNILPYIVLDSIIQSSFADLDLFFSIQKIGLQKKDFNYFGIE